MAFSIHTIYGLFFKMWRKKRHSFFLSEIRPTLQDSFLDVGGYPWYWVQYDPIVKLIVTLNLHTVSWDAAAHPRHQFSMVVGDGCDLPFGDKSYDIVFSNSVIEHVGDWRRQQQFAQEIRRVGVKVWVQTPAAECPFEPHYLAPFIHWVPQRWGLRKIAVRWLTPWGWLTRPTRESVATIVNDTRLLTRKEFEKLFPDFTIKVERILWLLPKSYIAIRK